VFSRAQGLPTNQDDDHAKYLSQKARVFGVGCNTVLGAITKDIISPYRYLVGKPSLYRFRLP